MGRKRTSWTRFDPRNVNQLKVIYEEANVCTNSEVTKYSAPCCAEEKCAESCAQMNSLVGGALDTFIGGIIDEMIDLVVEDENRSAPPSTVIDALHTDAVGKKEEKEKYFTLTVGDVQLGVPACTEDVKAFCNPEEALMTFLQANLPDTTFATFLATKTFGFR